MTLASFFATALNNFLTYAHVISWAMSDQEVIIRPIELPEDREAHVEMRTQLWEEFDREFLDHEALQLYGRIEQGNTEVFMAVTPEGEYCGFVETSLRDFAEGCKGDPVGYVDGWFVAEKFRKHGLGGMLVEACELWAKSKGCKEVACDVRVGNKASIAAHEKLGFVEIDRLVHFMKPLY